MRAHKLTLAALAVTAGLSLAACQNDDSADAAQSAPTSPTAAAPSTGESGSGSADQGGESGSSDSKPTGGSKPTGSKPAGDAGTERCRTDDLGITATDSTIGGDSEGSVAVALKNKTGRDCTLAGYAGVDLKTDSGSVSAERAGEAADPVVLEKGKTVFFGVTYPMNRTGGSGVRVTGLVVTPPNETKSVTLDWPGAGTLPVTDGSGSPVKVGPMGSAGQGG
ncbi:DUF4232 domain-containing protein [Streptomyces sp. NPDC048182]|uniref:DUF4232 domain-containing protein n=1 Tax=Streptomyces sp. NPDC048182 TaxID=3365507 RepID=UPI00371AB654